MLINFLLFMIGGLVSGLPTPDNLLVVQPAYKQYFTRVQPQVLFYSGGGQPFLIQPGQSPPGNFLIPDPNVIYGNRGGIGPDGNPLLVARYPKPAHVPPIEKDAEEIPTNPAQIPPQIGGNKPEKIETFNESDENDEKIPHFNQSPMTRNLRPGTRFFILNGQSLFSNYPTIQADPDESILKYQLLPTFRSLNTPEYFPNDQLINDEDDSVVIDARFESDEKAGEKKEDEKASEPTISQAQPSALALAGPGGVAASAPRGNAFVGKGGVAVSSPTATAVAGPSKDQKKKDDKKN